MPPNTLIVLTREPEDNAPLAALLSERGLGFLEYPCVATRPLPQEEWVLPEPARVEDFSVYAFTSRRAVAAAAHLAAALSGPGKTVAAVGEATALAAARLLGRPPSVVADPPTGEALGRALAASLPPGTRVLHFRGDRTTGSMADVLGASGLQLVEWVVYAHCRTELEPLPTDRPTLPVFASPSAAKAFFEANPSSGAVAASVAIGPTTAGWLRGRAPSMPVFEAAAPTPDGVFRAVLAALSQPDV